MIRNNYEINLDKIKVAKGVVEDMNEIKSTIIKEGEKDIKKFTSYQEILELKKIGDKLKSMVRI